VALNFRTYEVPTSARLSPSFGSSISFTIFGPVGWIATTDLGHVLSFHCRLCLRWGTQFDANHCIKGRSI